MPLVLLLQHIQLRPIHSLVSLSSAFTSRMILPLPSPCSVAKITREIVMLLLSLLQHYSPSYYSLPSFLVVRFHLLSHSFLHLVLWLRLLEKLLYCYSHSYNTIPLHSILSFLSLSCISTSCMTLPLPSPCFLVRITGGIVMLLLSISQRHFTLHSLASPCSAFASLTLPFSPCHSFSYPLFLWSEFLPLLPLWLVRFSHSISLATPLLFFCWFSHR